MVMMLWRIAHGFPAWLLLASIQLQVVNAVPITQNVCSTCHVNATCDVKHDGTGQMVCNCMYGFVGNGRTHCQDKDECQIGAHKICGEHTVCHNTHGSFYCTCLTGYSPSNHMAVFIPNDGTYCDDIDECEVQGICGAGGLCRNVPGSFNCTCSEGYTVRNGTEPFTPGTEGAACTVINCGQPPVIAHAAQLSVTGTDYGSVVVFGCRDGFVQKGGNNTAVCGARGLWQGPSLVCEEIDCGLPPVLQHSVMHWKNSTKLGSLVFYECDTGFYNVEGRNVSVCTINSSWDTSSIECKETDCSLPPLLPNTSSVWNGSTRPGSMAYYNCKPGFYSVGGSNVSVCALNGYWTNASLLCKEIDCGEPPFLPNSTVLRGSGTTVGSKAYYKCNRGFYNAGGSNASICAINGYWTHASLRCREIDCGQPPVLPHTETQGNGNTTVGATVHYYCKKGFHNVGGTNVSVCTMNGHWKNATIICKEIDCGEPPILPNTIRQGDISSGPGSAVYYICKEGFYDAGGRNISVCTFTGHWEKASLECKEIDCGEPPVLPNTIRQGDISSGPGSAVYYICKEGFYDTGGRNISVCTFTGHWEKASLECKEIDCGEPLGLPHTSMHWNSTVMGSVVYYECDEGFYSVGGRNTSICTTNGYWEDASIVCKEMNCGEPAHLPHTEIQWDLTANPGSMVYYQCKEEFYVESGKNYSICGENGQWEIATLHCAEINCGMPAPLPNTYVLWDNRTGLGSVVYYKCNEGFYHQGGQNHSTCTSDRQWENITVICEAVDCGSPPVLAHTEVAWHNGTAAGSLVQYRCQEGFSSKGGTGTSVCTNSGQWEPATLLCKERKPAINALVICNETCLCWKAERDGRASETYNVQFVGLRAYQKKFQHKKMIPFTSAEDKPKLCLNLLPGANYTINVTAVSAGFSSTINLTTSLRDPPIPEFTYKVVEGPLPSLRLRRAADTIDPISVYQVFVMPLSGPLSFNCSSPSSPHFYSRQKPRGAYVAAEIQTGEIRSELVFTVGDRRYYGEYYNAPLKEGEAYNIVLRTVSRWGRVRKQSCVIWAKTRASYTIQHVTIAAGGSVGLVLFIVFLGFSIAWYCKKK
ncbi:sushi domain-containing protein 1 isoform X2 [Amia ocellicauda]|uniref:sushi domain-containing protein 1 isoform X2 n=1 Tax=Amia ocellicauda TaxID=2972642 RepID=UPI003464487F